jgi:hypothetical protein
MAYTAKASVEASELVETTMRGGSGCWCMVLNTFFAGLLITR